MLRSQLCHNVCNSLRIFASRLRRRRRGKGVKGIRGKSSIRENLQGCCGYRVRSSCERRTDNRRSHWGTSRHAKHGCCQMPDRWSHPLPHRRTLRTNPSTTPRRCRACREDPTDLVLFCLRDASHLTSSHRTTLLPQGPSQRCQFILQTNDPPLVGTVMTQEAVEASFIRSARQDSARKGDRHRGIMCGRDFSRFGARSQSPFLARVFSCVAQS